MSNDLKPTYSGRILVVDDASANLRLLTNLLAGHGYAVYPASDGELALEFVRTTIPDLILLDIRMPGMDGYEVCRRLKAGESTASIPIIFISILEDERDKVKGFQMGAVDYITKPFQPEEVLARVGTHLRLRDLTERLEQKVAERTEELKILNQRLQMEIIERKQVGEALRKSEEKYRIVADNTYDWEFWLSPEGEFIYSSPSCKQITGYDPDRLLADPALLERMVHPDDRSRLADHRHTAGRMGQGVLEYRIIRSDGHIAWIEHVCRPVFDEKGTFLGTRGSNRDITDRKSAEQNIALLSFAIDNVSEAAFLIDEKARFHFVNEESCRILEYTRAELLGLGVPDVDPDFPAERWPGHWQELKERRSMSFEGRHKTKNGRIFPVEINANYLEYGGMAYNLALVRNITERKQAEDKLRKLNEELDQRVRERTHDLEKKNAELERMNKLFVGRELRMIELKEDRKKLEQEISMLKKQSGGGP